MITWLPRGYRTVTETQARRSRFLTTLARADDEDAARAVVDQARRTWPDARHHCSAFVVDVPGAQPVERSSDDGEPAGTAGTPMLEVLRGAGLTNVVVVVTRYFGGVLLGTGGLVRAYSDAVADALAAAPRVRPVERHLLRIRVRPDEAGRLQGALVGRGVDVIDAVWADEVFLTLATGDAARAAGIVRATLRREIALTSAGSTVTEEPLP